MLAAAQIEQYQRDGYLVAEELLTREELSRLRQRTVDVAQGRVEGFARQDIELEPGTDGTLAVAAVRKLNRCAENDPVFLAHCRNDKILDVVESILGPDIKLFGSQAFMKPPGGVEKPYHQDSAYFTIEPMDLVTCWTALDEVTLENGCMWVVRSSQLEALRDHSQPWTVGSRQDKQVPDGEIDRSREVPITMPAGGCSFHHSLLLHRSGPNRTPQSRRGLAVHYMSARSQWTDPARPQPNYLLMRGREWPGCV